MFVFIAFGAFMGYMVYNCMKTPVSLVSSEYYKDELNYQQVIDGTQKAGQLSKPVELAQDKAFVQLQLPDVHANRVEGKIWFYCVNDGRNDRKFVLQTDEYGTQRFAREQFTPGKYIAKIEWKTTEGNYYTEKKITIR